MFNRRNNNRGIIWTSLIGLGISAVAQLLWALEEMETEIC